MKLEFIQRDVLKEKPKDETKLGSAAGIMRRLSRMPTFRFPLRPRFCTIPRRFLRG